MTAKEILDQATARHGVDATFPINGGFYFLQRSGKLGEAIMEAMNEWGKICFDAAREIDKEDLYTESYLHDDYEDFLNSQSKHLPADEVEKDFDKKKEY